MRSYPISLRLGVSTLILGTLFLLFSPLNCFAIFPISTEPKEQPIAFSHKLHVGQNGIAYPILPSLRADRILLEFHPSAPASVAMALMDKSW